MEEKKKKNFTILGISIWKILAYFIIYSIIGYFVETIFGVITKGVIESRKSYLYGPFCTIYGLGAVVMIVFLQPFKKNHNTLFLGGFFIGSLTEYTVSLVGEKIFHVIWWDYSDMVLNINGRICILYSLFWGFIAIYLMQYAHPKIDKLVDKFIEKVSEKNFIIIVVILFTIIMIDKTITDNALKMFYVRKAYENNWNVIDKEFVDSTYKKVYMQDKKKAEFIYKYFGDRKMIRTFPNLKMVDKDGNILYFDKVVGDIQSYYFKVIKE